MKIYRSKVLRLLFILTFFGQTSIAQTSLSSEVNFDINKTFPAISVSPENLTKANTLKDLNKHFKPEWVETYLEVKISAITPSGTIIVKSNDNNLTEAQKELIHQAVKGSDISVNILYIPKNTLTHNDPKNWDFTFTIDPDNEAKFIGNKNKLNQYLREKAISKLPENSFEGYDFVVVKFTIDENGAIVNPHIYGNEFRTSKNEKVDQILLDAIMTMPKWEAASYSNGKKVKQECVFTVGNHKNCMINTLNIPKYALK